MTNILIPALRVRMPVRFTECTYLFVPRNLHNGCYSSTIYNRDELISFARHEINLACYVDKYFASLGISEERKKAIPVCKRHKQPK
jgi:hypothetical protein